MNPTVESSPDTLHRVLWIGLTLTAFCFPISIAASSLTLFPLIGIYVLAGYQTFKRWPPYWGNLEKAFAVFWGLSLLSGLLGVAPWHSQTRLVKDLYFVIVILMGAILAHNSQQTHRLMNVFLWGGLVTASFGILQVVVGIDQNERTGRVLEHVPPLLASLAAKPHAQWLTKCLWQLSMNDGRATGLRSHPLTFAETLLFPLAYTLSLQVIGPKETWWKSALAQAVLLVALLLSQSRGPWIAFGVMLLTVCVLVPRMQTLRRLAIWIVLPVIAIFLLPGLHQRAASIADRGFQSNAERVLMWKAGAYMFNDHRWLGVGPGNVRLVSAQYQSQAQHAAYGDWGHLHNTYITIAAERGALGLSAFLFFIGCLAIILLQAHRKVPQGEIDPRVLFLTALLGLVGWLVSGMTEMVYMDTSVLMVFYFVMGAALVAAKDYCKT